MEHAKHTVDDWKLAVAADKTRAGYWEWVEGQLEIDAVLDIIEQWHETS